MSLQVWLPLTKDLRNQGLSSANATNHGATYQSTGGKLGGCYYFSGSTSSYISTDYPTNIGTSDFSISLWVKIPTMTSGSYYAICSSKTSAAASTGFGIYWNYSQKKFLWSTADGSTATEIWMANTVDTIVYDKWIHLVMVRNSNDAKKGYFYINGIRYELASVPAIRNITTASNLYLGMCTSGNYAAKMYLNDFRIYDHALSQMEVKELAKGLVLHYPLSDNSIQQMNNCYSYPRFETSNSNGGWSHWGASGHVGTYGQTTDTNYIFRNGQTYAHWVADGSSATKDYLLYQEPAFDGGLRSLVAICKEENSKPITNNICYAAWNARNGGVVNNSWTSIQSLGNGFYLCKCEGISQDGSNDLVGIYIKPGYKVYFSEVYLENNRNMSSDIFFPTNIVYDCSGFCNNGTISGNLTISNDTPKYSVSTQFGSGKQITGAILPTDALTAAIWIKDTGSRPSSSICFRDAISHLAMGIQSNNLICGASGGAQTAYISNFSSNQTYKKGEWNHIVIIKNGNSYDIYINGIKQTLSSPSSQWSPGTPNDCLVVGSRGGSDFWPGKLSDLRIYATALSADDVKSLYQNSAYIDSSGNVYGAVHSEV